MLEGLDFNTVFVSIFTTSGWLGFFSKSYLDSHKERKNTINELKKENEDLKEMIKKHENIKDKEINIDKSYGSIYIENLLNYNVREICGYCWENSRMTIPIVSDEEYDDYSEKTYRTAYCPICKNNCRKSYMYTDTEEENPF